MQTAFFFSFSFFLVFFFFKFDIQSEKTLHIHEKVPPKLYNRNPVLSTAL